MLSFHKCPIKNFPKNDESPTKTVFLNEDMAVVYFADFGSQQQREYLFLIFIYGISYDGTILATLNDLLQILQLWKHTHIQGLYCIFLAR